MTDTPRAWCGDARAAIDRDSSYREALVQKDKAGNAPDGAPPGDISSDSEDRIADFISRHGGPGSPRREQTDPAGYRGWYEIYAADGYRLRCDWSRMGSREELSFSEIGPERTQGAPDNPA